MSSLRPLGISESMALLGVPMASMAVIRLSSSRSPSKGGRSRTSCIIRRSLPVTSSSSSMSLNRSPAIQRTSGQNNRSLQAVVLPSVISASTSAPASHISRSTSNGRSWASARASSTLLMPPALAPAMTSTITRRSSPAPISRSRSK